MLHVARARSNTQLEQDEHPHPGTAGRAPASQRRGAAAPRTDRRRPGMRPPLVLGLSPRPPSGCLWGSGSGAAHLPPVGWERSPPEKAAFSPRAVAKPSCVHPWELAKPRPGVGC